MECTCEKENFESLATGVLELPGEPAVVINGVPDVPGDDGNVVLDTCLVDESPRRGKPSDSTIDNQKLRNTGYGEWLRGREVRKLFGGTYYSGTVTEYDRKTGWYRVVYEDGDFEDLEWHELQEVLWPLDITLPLKSLAVKIIRESDKSEHGSQGKVVGETRRGAKTGGRRGRPRGRSSRSS